ncbi:MAG TPA: TSUP family transporter [Casimicrobiaceae bacterium]|nr:TSUP family transporter [Casimicrobiaceae bacterium]
MPPLPVLATLAAGILGTSFLSGIFGMAGGMLLMGLLLAVMPIAAAMALHGITQMTSNGWRAIVWRAHVRWRIVACFAAGSIAAAAAFAAFAAPPTKGVALLILGLTPFIGLALPSRLRLNVARPVHGVVCGAVCMTLQMIAGVSGPILDVFFVQSGLDRRGIVATKAAVQALGHALKLAYFGSLLMEGGDGLSPWLAGMAILLAVLGTQSSRRVLERISDTQFRTWSRRLIFALSLAYLGQGAWLTASPSL